MFDMNKIKSFCREKKVDLVIVGPEAPLARGITDFLETAGIKVCGPRYAAARMETSKIFAKEIMGGYNVPTAAFRIFDDVRRAENYIRAQGAPIVIKADGLAGGKGVTVASSVEEAIEAVQDILVKKVFGSAGNKIIVEECLEGEEVSILALTDGKNIIPLSSSQDHKRLYEGDKGPNTGGMGAYSPAPVMSNDLMGEITQSVLKPVIEGLKEEGMPYKGILYAGLMMTSDGPKVLEFNVRFGDPEIQALLPRMKTDLVELLAATADMDISNKTIEWEDKSCVCVVMVSAGYPGNYEKGKEINGINEASKEGAIVFHAGTAFKEGKLVTAGGRVLNVVGLGNNITEATENAYKGAKKISFDGMYYRRDIAHRALNRVANR
jgi:phosphoribosylamine--glycine ligase